MTKTGSPPRAHGGIIISIDGIQPDKGNETIYLVRDVVTGRLLAAENVRGGEILAHSQVAQQGHRNPPA